MSLCNVCSRISWENLPKVPDSAWPSSSGFEYLHTFHGWPTDVRGIPFHKCLQDLRHSANSLDCRLCSMILEQVESCRLQLEGQTQYDWPVWELEIVSRQVGDGFWVMSRTNRVRSVSVMLLAAIGLCVDDGDPLKHVIRGRPVEQDGGSLSAISRIRGWLDDCDKHPNCSPSEQILPSRVIDVGEDITSPHVKLRETDGHEIQKRYIALSYCWGEGPHFTTTRATLEDRKHLIAIEALPQMHKDAIKLARGLGIRYLWIDSICICQDDLKDWERESAKMLTVYANAYLTVGAYKSKDTSEGLSAGLTRRYVELEYSSGDLRGTALAFSLATRAETIPSDYVTLPNEPLSHRGWVLQERVLARRTLLYTSQQTCFECDKGIIGEDGLALDLRLIALNNILGEDVESAIKHQDNTHSPYRRPGQTEEVLVMWYELLWEYGERKLSHSSDKLPAISGLARIYANLLNDEYVAGLWRSHLLEGLLWRGLNCRRVQDYRAPSWSWASVDGIPAVDELGNYERLGEVLDVKITLKGENPYGEVTDGRLRLKAPMVPLRLDKISHTLKIRVKHGEVMSWFDYAFRDPDSKEEELRIAKSLEGVDIFALILIVGKTEKGIHTYRALLIRKVTDGEEYQRLGYAGLDELMLGRRVEEQPKEEFPVITLV